MPRELLVQGGYVVTVDPALGDLPEGDVLVTGDVITAVGAGLQPAAPGAEVIDARGRLVIPGLVDTHRHVWQGAIGAFTPQITGAGYEPAVLRGIAPLHALSKARLAWPSRRGCSCRSCFIRPPSCLSWPNPARHMPRSSPRF